MSTADDIFINIFNCKNQKNIAKTKNKHVPMSFYHTLLYNDTNVYYTQICKVNETNQAGVLQSKVLL